MFPRYLLIYLPVAQLDSASDSDSEGRRFESFRVGQKKGIASRYPLFWFIGEVRSFVEVPSNEKVAALLAALPAHAMRGRGSESFRVGQKGVLRIAGYAFLKCP